jgi:hypothetical protein
LETNRRPNAPRDQCWNDLACCRDALARSLRFTVTDPDLVLLRLAGNLEPQFPSGVAVLFVGPKEPEHPSFMLKLEEGHLVPLALGGKCTANKVVELFSQLSLERLCWGIGKSCPGLLFQLGNEFHELKVLFGVGAERRVAPFGEDRARHCGFGWCDRFVIWWCGVKWVWCAGGEVQEVLEVVEYCDGTEVWMRKRENERWQLLMRNCKSNCGRSHDRDQHVCCLPSLCYSYEF